MNQKDGKKYNFKINIIKIFYGSGFTKYSSNIYKIKDNNTLFVFLVPDNYFVTSSKKLILCRKKKTEYNRDIPRTKQRIAIHLWCCDVAYFVLSCIVMQGK